MADSSAITELREKFAKKYLAPESAKKFDQRDVTRFQKDDLFALSFIHWRQNVVDDAVELAASALEWRLENKISDLSVEGIGVDYFKKGSFFIHGRDLEGHRVLTNVVRLQSKAEKEDTKRIFCFWLERLQRNEPGQHITFILDTNGVPLKEVDIGTTRFLVDAFSNYFPDMLERIIVLDMPKVLNAIWSVVKLWLSERQKEKVIFCKTKDLGKFIAPDQLPEGMGGKSTWTYSFPPFPDDMNQDHAFKN